MHRRVYQVKLFRLRLPQVLRIHHRLIRRRRLLPRYDFHR